MPGATVEARWASTASPIDEVTQNRSPNVATAHSMMCSAGRQLQLGADVGHQLAQLLGGAALGVGAAGRAAWRVVAAVMSWLPRAGSGRASSR